MSAMVSACRSGGSITLSKIDNTSGGNFLARKNEVVQARSGQTRLSDVLVIEDEGIDSNRMTATLHILFGYNLKIRSAVTLAGAVDAVIERKPEVVILDDYLKPSDDAGQTIPFLRHAGFTGPILVVSGRATLTRRRELLKAGAAEVIHKDDVDSVRLSEALTRALQS